MADLDDFGIASISTALTSQFTLRNTLQESEVILDEDGLFHHACAYGEEWMFEAEGAGDIPADFALAGSGMTIVGVTGGVTVVDSSGERQQTGQANRWTGSGEIAPDAIAAA